jgi:RNA polymerase sigma-70 factor (ECF subfamily)
MHAEHSPDGDRALFERLFADHYGELMRFAIRRVGSDLAPDVVSSTFLVAWRRLSDIPVERSRAWLYATSRHVIANEQRASRRREQLDRKARSQPGQATTDDHVAGLADQIRVRTVLATLSEGDQEVLRLTAWDGLDIAECAEVLGCSRTAMKVRLHRAGRRFAARLAAADDEEHEPAPESVERMCAQPTLVPGRTAT